MRNGPCPAGGSKRPDVADKSDTQLLELALDALRRHVGVTAEPSAVIAGVHHGCIPQYEVGHGQLIRDARESVRGVFGDRLLLTGNSFDGIGAADCVVAATAAADAVLKKMVPT